MVQVKPVGKIHFTTDGQAASCGRQGAKESTMSFSDVTCRWCISKVNDDPCRFLMGLQIAGAPKPILQQIWAIATKNGNPLDDTKNRIKDLHVELALRESILTSLAKLNL